MSLAFLAKKSWHPATIHNTEMVWKAEMKKEEEEKKLALIRKQLQEEKILEDLRKQQGITGHDRLGWMYAPINKTTDAEEYLLGKKYEGESEKNDVQKLEETKAAGTLLLQQQAPAGGTYLDDMNKMRADPLLEIKRREKEARDRIKDNPLKMQQLAKEIEMAKNAKMEKKAMKKFLKKESKKKMKKHGSDDERDRRHDGGRRRSVSPRHGRDERRDRDRSPRRDRDDRRDRDRSPRRREERRDRERSPPRRDRVEERSHTHDKPSTNSSVAGEKPPTWTKGYGLQLPPGLAEVKAAEKSAGISVPQIEKKIEKVDVKPLVLPPERKSAKGLTAEEKAERLREMSMNASVHQEKRYSRYQKDEARAQLESIEPTQTEKDDVNFMAKLNTGTYMNSDDTLEDRVRKRSHYRQTIAEE